MHVYILDLVMTNVSQRFQAAQRLPAILLVWFGLVIGVSFIATPAKFIVPELDLITAIKVGRATFHVFLYVEGSIAATIVLILLTQNLSRIKRLYLGSLITLFLLQQTVISPLVKINSESLFNGNADYSSYPHIVFIGTEVIKALLLVGYTTITNRIETAFEEKDKTSHV